MILPSQEKSSILFEYIVAQGCYAVGPDFQVFVKYSIEPFVKRVYMSVAVCDTFISSPLVYSGVLSH